MTFEDLRSCFSVAFDCPVEDISEDTDIACDLGGDDLAVTELLFTLDADYGITVGEEIAKDCQTVGDLWRVVDDIQQNEEL